ncbi:type II toxin-antitoxin system Phd/YefM family antitoxin [Aerococcus agrisoli]|uniref:Antitoxin n=1 Tax=Aerococcus agrisoli TaxID=2487350 RepID=A0A3N4GEF8_9LACT|nr:type II toxin-antitoxin system prevent-host-death family antitoxin [Aerococcus agrisoli]RPA60595.1 type II toxin-antitoxin system Phd/YefM family antitoxin [Aerococcus agrisoli]
MSKIIMNPTAARKNFYQILKDVNKNQYEVEIISENKENDAVIISRANWNAIQETLFLQDNGVLDKVHERMKDNSGTTDIDDIDWDDL